MRYKLHVLATAALILSGAAASAQTVMAPGPALPGNAVTGGIGPGATQIAPGPGNRFFDRAGRVGRRSAGDWIA
jgi:hypothetical protein